MLHIQKFLRNGGTLQDLKDLYAISSNRHKQFPNLVGFKYSQIESPMGESICQEARGLVLDEADSWRIVCYTFRKFFNAGEGHGDPLTEPKHVYEKVDGTLIQVYYWENAWRTATTGRPDASGEYSPLVPGETFHDLFQKVFTAKKYRDLPSTLSHLCFGFELATAYNRIVCRYDIERLPLLMVRNRVTGLELNPEQFVSDHNLNWELPKKYPVRSLPEIQVASQSLLPLEAEGYVVVGEPRLDGSYTRLKVKSPAYVATAHLKEGCTPKKLLEIARCGECSELLTYFPEFKASYDTIAARYETFVRELEAVWERNKGIESQKEFALAIKNCAGTGVLFGVRKGSYPSIRAGLKAIRIDSLWNEIYGEKHVGTTHN